MTREKLPARRLCETITFTHLNVVYQGTVGFYEDGRLAEVFLHGPKAGTDLDAIARDAAVTTSLALQHGAPLDVILGALTRDADGQPAGAMGVLLEQIAAIQAASAQGGAA